MLSVIISTFNSERTLVPLLAVLVPGAMSGLVREAIVSDGGSSDATLAVAALAGCMVLAPPQPAKLGARLAAAATAARAPWLMFLRAGTVLDANWFDETALFIAEADQADAAGAAAVFRPSASARTAHPMLREAMSRLRFGVLGRAHPDQGLLIATRLYRAIGGHRDGAADPEAALLARLGRRRLMMLRAGARIVAAK